MRLAHAVTFHRAAQIYSITNKHHRSLASSKPCRVLTRAHPVNDLLAAPPQQPRPDVEHCGTLGPGLKLIKQEIAIGSQSFSLVVPESTDEVTDYYIETGRLGGDPYWCRPWPSAVVLAKLLTDHPELVRRKSVCEIGAGLGIAGTVSATLGAREVILTDREPLALECALHSAEANGVPVSQVAKSSLVRDNRNSTTLRVGACELDWCSEDPKIGKFDTILACDVIYEIHAVQAVASLIPRLLNENGGKFILADPKGRTPEHRKELTALLLDNLKFPMVLESSSLQSTIMDGTQSEIEVLIFACNYTNTTIGVKQ